MSDRKKLQEQINDLNKAYQEYDLKLRKTGASMEQRQQLRDMMNTKKNQLISELGDDLQKLNQGGSIAFKSGKEAAEKGGKKVLKKLAGVIPLMGTGAALLSGDPAMAAEEAIEDLAGPASMALKSEGVGMSPEEENIMLAERNAQRKYDKSPAAQDAAKSRGETLPKLRAAIGPERFQALSGQSPSSVQNNNILEKAEEDEELKKRLAIMGGLSRD